MRPPETKTEKPRVIFECLDCGQEFLARVDEGDPDPECVHCWRERRKGERLQEMLDTQTPPGKLAGIRGADVAYKVMEEMGYTDMKDNLCEGDSAAPSLTPPSPSEQAALVRAQMEMKYASLTAPVSAASGVQAAWGGVPQTAEQQTGKIDIMAVGRAASEAAKREASDPIAFLETAKRIGHRPKYNVLARGDRDGNVAMPNVRRRG